MLQVNSGKLEELVHAITPIAEGILRGYCFYRYVEPFLRFSSAEHEIYPPKTGESFFLPFCVPKKKGAALGGTAYALTMLLIYTARLSVDAYVIYGMASFAMLFVICLMDRRNYRQKLFLAVTFFALNWFAAGMAEILYDFLYDAAAGTDYMQNHPELFFALYVLMCICFLAMELAFTAAGLWQVVRVYPNKSEEMGNKELALLSLPSLMGLLGYEIMRYYRVFYVLETGKMEKTYDRMTLLFCLVSSVTVIAVILLYQRIRVAQEENQQAEFLAAQMDSVRRHIELVESLYHKTRGIRHDMANHMMTLEKLYEGSNPKEAKAYSRSLQTALAQMTGGIESGNPVTNVILQEFAKEAENRGIAFQSEFYYPAKTEIDAFDISVVLNNALQNAVEHTKKGGENRISIVSYRRNNAYIMEICNSFSGSLKWNAETGLPLTTKEQAKGHGYGLSNIRRVAGKYAGDIDITLKDGEFCLCILLMAE